MGGRVYCWGVGGARGEQCRDKVCVASPLLNTLPPPPLPSSYFNVTPAGQDRVLKWGIASAAVLRLAMVGAGAELIANFKPVLLVFAAILVYSAVKLAFVEEGEGEEDMGENGVVKLCR